MKTLIIGARGNVGSELVKLYIKTSLPFIAASRQPEKIEDTSVEKVYFDFYDEASHSQVLDGIDKIFIVPPQGNIRTLYQEVNQFIDKAIAKGVKHITFHSARAVEFIEQKLSNHLIEEHLEKCNISYTILRPNWFMQNFNGWFLGMMKQSGRVFLPTGEGKSCFIDTRDIAEVAYKTLTGSDKHNGRIYSLAGPDSLTMQEALDKIGKITGEQYNFIDISQDEFIKSSVERGMPENAARFVAQLFQLVKNGTESEPVNDIINILGKVRSFEQYVNDYVNYWK